MNKPYYEKTFERHRKDLSDVEFGKRSDIRFNEELGYLYVMIIEKLKHFEGEMAGQKIKLENWQVKVLVILFGWQKKRLDEKGNQIVINNNPEWVRRFDTAFLFIPRKNGKSIIASGVCIAEAILTIENGNQIVSFATKREQAQIVYRGCKKMLETIDLDIEYSESYSKLQIKGNDVSIGTLSKDSKSQDGLNVGLGVGDEMHAFKDREQIDVVQSSQGARMQPMMFYITTAGNNIYSPGAIEYEYAKNIMEGVIENDGYFAFICELDKDDDPFDESVWHKANPNLGVSKSWDYMRKQSKQAQERSESKNNFLIKELNRWVNASEHFIELKDWDDCGVDKIDLSSAKEILLGVDLSRSDDFTAIAITYVLPNNRLHTTQHYYIPKDNVKQRESELRVPLTRWILEGHITATPGLTIDYDYIQKDIIDYIKRGLFGIYYDVAFASTLISNIERETNFDMCVEIRQGYTTISEPTYNFKDFIKSKRLTHDKNPVTRWMITNFSVERNSYGNIKPNKMNRNRKIDGPAAIINTLKGLILLEPEEKSVYEERGIRNID